MNAHSKLCQLVCLALSGCLNAEFEQGSEAEPEAIADEPTTATTEQALGNSHFHQERIGGNIFQQPFEPYVTQRFDPLGDCTPGFVRPVRPTVGWTSGSGGWCGFSTWATGHADDCRAVIVGATAAFGGTCTTSIQEVKKMSGQQGAFTFNAGNTNSATVNTTDFAIAANAGQTLTVTTCSDRGGSASGDTYLRLSDLWGVEAAANDDNCGLASKIVYTATSGGSFTIHAGCWSNGGCSGTVAWSIQ